MDTNNPALLLCSPTVTEFDLIFYIYLFVCALTSYCEYRWFYYRFLSSFLLAGYMVDLLPLLNICLNQWAFSFPNFYVSVVAFSFSLRKAPLRFLIKLVLRCWALLVLLLCKTLDLSIKSEGEPCWVEYFWLWAFPFHDFKYTMPLPSGMQRLSWKVSW